MHRNLRWGLGGTVALTLAALWVPQRSNNVIGAVDFQSQQREATSASSLARHGVSQDVRLPLPERLPQTDYEPARRDLFASRQVLQASAVLVPPAPASLPPVPQPTAPSLSYRYLGGMTTPEGQRLIYMARGETAAQVKEGDRLEDGYVVESIGAAGITLVYPSLGTKLIVPIPPAPAQ